MLPLTIFVEASVLAKLAATPSSVEFCTSNFTPGAAVPIPTLPDEFQTPEPGNQAAFETVKYVVEAFVIVPPVVVRLVMVPLVDQKLVAVRLVEEALVRVAVVAVKLFAVTSPLGAIEKTEEVEE